MSVLVLAVVLSTACVISTGKVDVVLSTLTWAPKTIHSAVCYVAPPAPPAALNSTDVPSAADQIANTVVYQLRAELGDLKDLKKKADDAEAILKFVEKFLAESGNRDEVIKEYLHKHTVATNALAKVSHEAAEEKRNATADADATKHRLRAGYFSTGVLIACTTFFFTKDSVATTIVVASYYVLQIICENFPWEAPAFAAFMGVMALIAETVVQRCASARRTPVPTTVPTAAPTIAETPCAPAQVAPSDTVFKPHTLLGSPRTMRETKRYAAPEPTEVDSFTAPFGGPSTDLDHDVVNDY